jgi:tetratricopeptide (TPR) repeat protein
VGGRLPYLWIGAAALLVGGLGLFIVFGGSDPLSTGGRPLVSLMPETERSEVQRDYVSLVDTARADLRIGNDSGAMININRAIEMPTADAEAFLVRAEVYRRQGDTDTALADLRDAMEQYPRYAEATAAIGWIHFEKGSLDEADQSFQDAVGFDGDLSAAQAGIGAVLSAREQHVEALQVLDAAAEDHPRSGLVHAYLGRAQLALDMTDPAIQSLVDAKRLDPRLGGVYADLADAYLRKGDERAAEQQLSAALLTANATDSVRSQMAALMLGQGRFPEAATVLRPIYHASAAGDVHVMWGMIELGQGSREEGIAAIKNGLDRGASEPGKLHEVLGALMLEEENWEEAARHCLAAFIAGNIEGRLFANWGVARFHLGQYVDAADNLEQAVNRDGDDLFARYTLGVLYMDYLNQPELARQQFQAYHAAGGRDPKVNGWLRSLGG